MRHIRILILAALTVSISAKLNAVDLSSFTRNDWVGWSEVQQIQFLAWAAYGMLVSTQNATQTIHEFAATFQAIELAQKQAELTFTTLSLLKDVVVRNGI